MYIVVLIVIIITFDIIIIMKRNFSNMFFCLQATLLLIH